MTNEEVTRQPEEATVDVDQNQEQVDHVAESAAEEQTEEQVEAPSLESLLVEVETLRAKVDDQKDSVIRAHAEMQNVRRRSERDVENAHKFALDKFSSDLLPVVDSLERALDAAENMENDAVKGMSDGVELTLKMFIDALAKHGVEQVDPIGQPFNPELHQAMSMVPNPDMAPNSVMAVMQKGYTLRGRLVRPAMVVVSQAAK